MTTSHSPLRVLMAQADLVAKQIKKAERGEPISPALDESARKSRERGQFVTGIVMDDKVVKITLPWPMIEATSEAGLSAYILKLMRGEREQ